MDFSKFELNYLVDCSFACRIKEKSLLITVKHNLLGSQKSANFPLPSLKEIF